MPRDLLPYPLAGADPDPGPVQVAPHPAAHRSRSYGPLAAILALAVLVLAALWLAERRTSESLREDLRQLRDQAESAQQPVTERRLFGPEMTAASLGLARYLEQQAPGTMPREFVEAFFGYPKQTTAWSPLSDGQTPSRVLGKIDDATDPKVVWVSRRSAQTIDRSRPARRDCLRLDIAAALSAAAANRPLGDPAEPAPLRSWQHVYTFVPAEQCGR